MSHSSRVCSDSGSKEKRPMVVGVGRGISGSVKSLGNITLSVGAVVKASWVAALSRRAAGGNGS